MMLIAGGSQALGSIFGAFTQSSAAQKATDAQMAMFNRIQQQMAPFINLGANWGVPGVQAATERFEQAIPGLTAPMTAEDVRNTPGFQFMLDKGLEATQAGFAAKGLSSSGAAMRGAGEFETGLASTTIPTWLNMLLGQRQQEYNMLKGGIDPYMAAVQAGAGAAGQLGQFGTTVGGQVGSNIMGAGNVQAAAGMNIANAIGSAPGQYMQYALFNKLMGPAGGPAPV
jgi:hypothetical protein